MYGAFFYVLFVLFLGVNNWAVAVSAWRKKSIMTALAFCTSFIWSLLFFFSFFGNINLYFLLFIGYVCAVLYNVKIFILEDKGRLTKVILFYNGLGCLIIFLRVLSGHGIDFTGVFSGVFHTITLSHTLFEMITFFFLQIFYPTMFIPPILLNQKPKRFISRVGTKAVKGIAVYAVVLILCLMVPAGVMISSFADIPVFEKEYAQAPVHFGVKVNSFANEAETMEDWEELLLQEIAIAKELDLDYMEFYVDKSYIDEMNQQLGEGLNRVREEGFGIILGCMGSPDWLFNPVPLEEHNNTMRNDALALAAFHPDYLIVIVEPIARHNSMLLQNPLSVEEWVSLINGIALQVRAIDEHVKVAVALAATEEGLTLFEALQTSHIDAVGIDVHPFHKDMVDIMYVYAHKAQKELWVFEFGMETYNFGEETQAKYMGYLPKIASDLHFSGVVQYDIMDNPYSQLGLVYTTGEKKLGFYAYKNAIERIRGSQPDFSEMLKEKQKDNMFMLILILIFSYLILRRIKR